MRNFISYDESINILNNLNISKITTEKLFITNAVGKVIANDVIANHNNPEFLTSAMDGYAIKFEDIKNENIKIIGKILLEVLLKHKLQWALVLKLLQVH